MLLQDGKGNRPEDMPRLAAFLNSSLRIGQTANTFKNRGGRGEIWMMSNRGWTFITPDGTLILWDGTNAANGQVLAELGPELFHTRTALIQQSTITDDDDSVAPNSIVTAVQQKTDLVRPPACSKTIWDLVNAGCWAVVIGTS